jgi:hypothetical protein
LEFVIKGERRRKKIEEALAIRSTRLRKSWQEADEELTKIGK